MKGLFAQPAGSGRSGQTRNLRGSDPRVPVSASSGIVPRLAVGLIALLLIAEGRPTAANPSSGDTGATFAVRGGPEAEELCKQATQLFRQAETATAGLEAAQSEGRLAKVARQSFVELYSNITQLDRLAGRLIIRREPAGEDLQLRARHLRERMQQLLAEYLNTPESREELARTVPRLRREVQSRSRVLPRLAQLVDQQKWEEAEGVLFEAVDPLEAQCVGFDSATRATVLEPFGEAMSIIVDRTRRFREQQAMEALAGLRSQQAPGGDTLVDLLRQAAGQVAAGGRATWDGRSIGGPALVAELAARWEQQHLQAVHCLALDWARGDQLGWQQQQQLKSKFQQWVVELASGIGRLIAADTARLGGEELRAAYMAYLGQLAVLAVRVDDEQFTRALAQSLERVAAQSPELQREVLSYRQATGELLRWRSRYTADRAQSLLAQYVPAERLLGDALAECLKTSGSHSAAAVHVARAELCCPAPQLVQQAAAVLAGRGVLLADCEGSATETPAVASHYRPRVYGWFRLPEALAAAWSEQTAALEADLFVDDRSPPLTLEAAMALASAKQYRLAAAGGSVSKLTVEALVTRFATLSQSGSRLVPLGRLPDETLGDQPLRQILFQLELEPAWMQHACFLVEPPARR